jgi:ferrous iron transport protein B
LSQEAVVALLGNPNTGKTTLFNLLTGLRQRVANYPGVTVERKSGRFRHKGVTFEVLDLPGTYSLSPRSPDEMIAVDVLLGLQPGEPRPDVLVAIADASNLERNLYLATQLLELGLPVVLALNMVDLARQAGREYDAGRLEEALGVRVVPMQAHRGLGVTELKDAIVEALGAPDAPGRRQRGPTFPPEFLAHQQQLAQRIQLAILAGKGPKEAQQAALFLARRALLDQGGYVEKRLTSRLGSEFASELAQVRRDLDASGCSVAGMEAPLRYAWIREQLDGCYRELPRPAQDWTDRLDAILTHRIWGLVIFLAVMFLLFQAIFTLAQPLMEAILQVQGLLVEGVQQAMPPGPLRSLITDGILEGVGSVLVFLPQIMILFGLIAILEDCGYMARAAYLMDKIMSRCGLSGKSFIPLLSCFACAIPGIMATRVIEDRRDRLATILVAPLMSCSARLPVYLLLTAAFVPGDTWLGPWLPGTVLFSMYLVGLVLAPWVAWVLKRTVLRGETPIFLLELPAYKWPSPGLVLYRMYDRGKAFVLRAGTVILATMVLVWALLYFPRQGSDASGATFFFDQKLAEAERELAELRAAMAHSGERGEEAGDRARLERQIEELVAEAVRLQGAWKRNSWLGRLGKVLEPAVVPLGWDWRIAMATLASLPAREVVIGAMGVIYDVGPDVDERSTELQAQLKAARWEPGSARQGQPVFTLATALSLMVFFALCCQCASTIAVIRRETNSWGWALFTFGYMTTLAYLGALLTYQTARFLGA